MQVDLITRSVIKRNLVVDNLEAVKLQAYIQKVGIESTIEKISGLQKGSDMFNKVLEYYNAI